MVALLKYGSYLLNLVDNFLSILVFGNGAGVIGNTLGRSKYLFLRLFHPLPLKSSGQEEANELKERGFLVLQNILPGEVTHLVKRRMAEALSDHSKSRPAAVAKAYGYPDACIEVNSPLESIPELKGFVTEQLNVILQNYFRCDFHLNRVSMFRTAYYPKNNNQIECFSDNWHFDKLDFYNTAHLIVYLNDDVTSLTGAIRFHNAAASRRLSRKGFLDRKIVRRKLRNELETSSTLTVFEGDTGSCCLFLNSICIHRAAIPAPGAYRDAVVLSFFPGHV